MAEQDLKSAIDFEKIDYFSDPEVANDLPEYLAAMRAKCPVLRERFHGVYMVTGYEEAMEVLHRQNAAFSSAVTVTKPATPGGAMLGTLIDRCGLAGVS